MAPTNTSDSPALPSSCPICTNPFSFTKQPFLLPCNHTVCTSCLPNLPKRSCPTCHTPTPPVSHVLAQKPGVMSTEAPNHGSDTDDNTWEFPRCPTHHKKLHSWCVNHKHVVCSHCKESPEHEKCEIKPSAEIDREVERLVGHVGEVMADAERERSEFEKMLKGHFEDAVGVIEGMERACGEAKEHLAKARAEHQSAANESITHQLEPYTQITNQISQMDTAARRTLIETLRKMEKDTWEKRTFAKTSAALPNKNTWAARFMSAQLGGGTMIKVLRGKCTKCKHVTKFESLKFTSGAGFLGNAGAEVTGVCKDGHMCEGVMRKVTVHESFPKTYVGVCTCDEKHQREWTGVYDGKFYPDIDQQDCTFKCDGEVEVTCEVVDAEEPTKIDHVMGRMLENVVQVVITESDA